MDNNVKNICTIAKYISFPQLDKYDYCDIGWDYNETDHSYSSSHVLIQNILKENKHAIAIQLKKSAPNVDFTHILDSDMDFTNSILLYALGPCCIWYGSHPNNITKHTSFQILTMLIDNGVKDRINENYYRKKSHTRVEYSICDDPVSAVELACMFGCEEILIALFKNKNTCHNVLKVQYVEILMKMVLFNTSETDIGVKCS